MPEVIFPSPWLKINENVKSGDTIRFIDSGKWESEPGRDDRYVITVAVFRGKDLIEADKKFNLNKTNFKAVSALYGTNSDNWLNKDMTVAAIKARNPQTGQAVDSILLEAPAAPAEAAPAAPAEPAK